MSADVTVPKVDLNTPLPEMDIPVVDTVMVKAKREWVVGIGVFGVFVMILGIIGYFYNTQNTQAVSKSVNQQVVSVPVESVAPAVEMKAIFAVWNGSGVPGAAGKMADKLKAEGYEVVETKNAPEEQVGTTVEMTESMISHQAEIMRIVGVTNVPAGPGLAGYVIVPARPGPMGNLEYSVKIIIGK